MDKKERHLAYIPLVAALASSAIPSTEAYAQGWRPGTGSGHPYPSRQAICSWLCPANKMYLDSINAHYDSVMTSKIDSVSNYYNSLINKKMTSLADSLTRLYAPRLPAQRPGVPTQTQPRQTTRQPTRPQPRTPTTQPRQPAQRPDTTYAPIQPTRQDTTRTYAPRDTIKLIPGQRPRRETGIARTAEKTKRKTDRFSLGLEALAGTNKELAAGGYLKFGFTPSFAVELGANYAFRQEGPYLLGETSDVTQREIELVGPAGTYHTRTDSVATTTNRQGIAEGGARIVISPTKWLDFFVGGGIRPSDKITETYQQSEIGLTRNEKVVRLDTLENTIPERTFVYPAFGEIGARVKLPKIPVNVNLRYNRTGKQNIGKAGIGFNF